MQIVLDFKALSELKNHSKEINTKLTNKIVPEMLKEAISVKKEKPEGKT